MIRKQLELKCCHNCLSEEYDNGCDVCKRFHKVVEPTDICEEFVRKFVWNWIILI